MKQQILLALPLIGAVIAHPTLSRREVPQEHAHENVLTVIDQLLAQNNPDKIQASVFGLLGAKAAAEGAGNIKDAGKFNLRHSRKGIVLTCCNRLSSASYG
jgi:N-acetylglucosamine kinase-like BadF-type ATPase